MAITNGLLLERQKHILPKTQPQLALLHGMQPSNQLLSHHFILVTVYRQTMPKYLAARFQFKMEKASGFN